MSAMTGSGRHGDQRKAPTLPTGARPPFRAVIVDLDGVVVDATAREPAGHGVRVRPDTEALLRRLRDGGVSIGAVTARNDVHALLTATGVRDLFETVVDGASASAPGAFDQPAPEVFLEAARRLRVEPGQAAVIAHDITSVQAARRGRFGLVVGIVRSGNRADLESAGADLVVENVSQLDLGVLRADPWVMTYEGFDPAHEGHREALTTLANGYLGTRGAAPEARADGVRYPGTYLAGVYNRLTSAIGGREVEDEHLVNAPNWLPFDLRIPPGDWWSEGGLTAQSERRDLDLRTGVLTRRLTLVHSDGRAILLTQRRLVSMARPHVAALETTLEAEGWDGSVTVRCGIDAGVRNDNVEEYRNLAGQHLTGIRAEAVGEDVLLVQAETTTSRIRVATAARTTTSAVLGDRVPLVQPGPGYHALELTVRLRSGQPVTVDKAVAVVTSRDAAISSPGQGALDELDRAPAGFNALLDEHREAWARLWDLFRIELPGASLQDQLVMNLHLFHLVQTITSHTAGLDAGVPPRGLHGEGYRGHVFWDELFVLPLFTTHLPGVSRSLLDYRWRRLPAARHAAQAAGLTGALFPWQSGSDGREETPVQLFNVRSQRWMPDNSSRQRHVGLAVAYNAWQYYQATGDVAWLSDRGGELIIEVARLFAGMSTYDADQDRFHIDGVMGPDEYHDGYPDRPGGGLRDNAYTNVLAAWVCRRALDVLDLLREHAGSDLATRLHLDPDEQARFGRLGRRLTVPFHDGVISQFAGYEALEELDWDRYRRTYGNIGRLDLILEAEGDSTNRYKLAKQADVLMLMYLFGATDLLELLDGLGYPTDLRTLTDTVDYYLARTAHGSTLSRVVHASVLAQFEPARAWALFREALVADLDDTQGGTTEEGVHLGAMGGTVDIVTRSFAGMRLDPELCFDPRLPPELAGLRLKVCYRGDDVAVAVDHDRVHIEGRRGQHVAAGP